MTNENLSELRNQVSVICHSANNVLTTLMGNITLAKIYMKENIDKATGRLVNAEESARLLKECLLELGSLADPN